MSLHKQVPSVLTHGGGSDDAIAATLEAQAANDKIQKQVMLEGTKGRKPVDRRHLHFDDPTEETVEPEVEEAKKEVQAKKEEAKPEPKKEVKA